MKRARLPTLVTVLLLIAGASAPAVRADVLTFLPTDDTFIDHLYPNTVNGAYWAAIVRAMGTHYHKHGLDIGYELDTLVRFDVSSIAPYTPISSATLRFYYFAYWDVDPAELPYGCFRITENWYEESVTWKLQPGWASEPTAVTAVPSAFGWMAWDVTADVQAFVDQQQPNYGWVIHDGAPYTGPASCFYTKEYGSYLPYLEVVTVPAGTMHVAAIDMGYAFAGGKYKKYTKVKIVDGSGAGLGGAVVDLTLTRPGGASTAYSGTTATDGTVTFQYGPTKQTGTYTAAVTGVSKAGWTYAYWENQETSDSLLVP